LAFKKETEKQLKERDAKIVKLAAQNKRKLDALVEYQKSIAEIKEENSSLLQYVRANENFLVEEYSNYVA
jgi:hypothetical protein